MTTNSGTNRTPSKSREEAISDITIALEFVACALRELVNGHPPPSKEVQEPVMFAWAKLAEVKSGI